MNSVSLAPKAQTAIDILSRLQIQTGPAMLAYWVTPNTILTLSGARAYCDGVFYNKKGFAELKVWVKEITASIGVLKSLTDVYFAASRLDKTNGLEDYASYDMVFTQGLTYSLEQTLLLGSEKHDLVTRKLSDRRLSLAIRNLLKANPNLKHFNNVNLDHIANGIVLGYPDKAILGSASEWEKDDPFAEPLMDADIRGSRYYFCPAPIYSYPRSLVNDPTIKAHELLWSSILQDFYKSDFHKTLAKQPEFKKKAKALGMTG